MITTRRLWPALAVLVGLLPVVAAWQAAPAEAPRAAAPPDSGWTPLFNGKDLSGWETWLTRAPGAQTPLGLGNDPLGVFRVQQDGSLRISGQVFGALTSTEAFGDYHLRLEQKWGQKKWPPRLDRPRDSGLNYHATGPHGVFAGVFMQSCQLQIGEGSTGEHWGIAGTLADAAALPEEGGVRYRPGSPLVTVARGGIRADGAVEAPAGQWNRIELIARGDSAAYFVNGREVMKVHRLRRPVDGREEPLTAGRLQLQSEGAEVFYRNIEIRRFE